MDYISKTNQMFHIDHIDGKHLILKTCPECFMCFYGDPKIKLEKCKECSKENKDGQN